MDEGAVRSLTPASSSGHARSDPRLPGEFRAGARRTLFHSATARGLACLALLTLLFLREPILRFGEAHYSCADLLQGFTLTRVQPTQPATNLLLSDPCVQMLPWTMLARSEFAHGRWPLWNPFNGLGAPLFANYQSGVLSVFNLPFYVVGMRLALLLSAFMKLFFLGGFTFLFLRRLGLGALAALVGGMAFEFSGHNVVLLGYPHPGAMATLPAGVYAVECAVRRLIERRNVRAAVGPAFGVFAVLALGALAGHPEAFYFAALGIGLYTALRLAMLLATHRSWQGSSGQVIGLSALLAGAAVLAMGASAVQSLPFFEYLEESTMAVARQGDQTPLYRFNWPLHVYPDVYGAAVDTRRPNPEWPLINYEASVCDYAGVTSLILALLALFAARKQWFARAFGAAALLWIGYAYNFFDLGHLLGRLPTVGMAPINRSQGLYLFAVACLVGVAVDRLVRREPALDRRRAVLGLAVAAGLIALAYEAAWLRVRGFDLRGTTAPEFYADVVGHIRRITWMAGASLALVALMLWFERRVARTLLALALGGMIWVQTAQLLHAYNPTIPDRFFYTPTRHTMGMRALAKDEPIVVVGRDTIPPCGNIPYGLTLLPNYDAMGIRGIDQLMLSKFDSMGNWQPTVNVSHHGMRLFGSRHVVLTRTNEGLGQVSERAQWDPRHEFATAPLTPSRPMRQTFTAERDGLCSIAVRVDRLGHDQGDARIRLSLFDAERGTLVAEQSWRVEDLLFNRRPESRASMCFDAVADSQGRRYLLLIEGLGTSAEKGVRLVGSRAGERFLRQRSFALPIGAAPFDPRLRPRSLGACAAFDGTERLTGTLQFDCGYGLDPQELLETLGDHAVYRWNIGLGRAFFIDQALTVPQPSMALEWVRAATFDPTKHVVLVDDAPKRTLPEGKTTVREARYRRVHPQLVEVETENAEDGWVYIAQPFYPGWRATLDGQPAEILRANYAFMAVAVGGGKHTIRLEYDPRSFQVGAWISLLSTALALLLFWWGLRTPRA